MKYILLLGLFFSQTSFAEESYNQKCGNGEKCLGPIITDSKIDCNLKINALLPECKGEVEPPKDSCGLDGKLCETTTESKCPISQESWNETCTQDSGVRCVKAPCPQARKIVDSPYCKKLSSLCGNHKHHKPKKLECRIIPGSDSASCKGVIYVRQDKINVKDAVDSATSVLTYKDVKTLGEEPRAIGEKPSYDASSSSSGLDSSSSTEK